MAASLISGGMAVEVHETALVIELGQQTAEYGGLLRSSYKPVKKFVMK
jgi:hypothetical protein